MIKTKFVQQAQTIAKYVSINPMTNKVFFETPVHSDAEVEKRLSKAHNYFQKTRRDGPVEVKRKFEKLRSVSSIMLDRKAELAELMTKEMGKPITQSLGEVERCRIHIDYSIKTTLGYLEDQPIENVYHRSFLTHEPIGPYLNIVPWNFPLWIPFKSMIPPFLCGNPILMKMSPSTPQCALAVEKVFQDAGFVDGEYQNLFISNKQAEKVLSDKRVGGVKFTGSTRGGRQVARIAGENMKPGCYELGGSDPFIVLEDSDIDLAVSKGFLSRMVNNGQACINAKRFLVHDSIYDVFKDGIIEKIKNNKMGDPLNKEVFLGPLALEHLAEELRTQVRDSIKQGATLSFGSPEKPSNLPQEANFFEPTILENIPVDSRAYSEELFGPVFSLYRFKDDQQAIDIANDTQYGLGAAIFSKDNERAVKMARQVDAGMLFVNDIVARVSEVPSGGCKQSGHGREMDKAGLTGLSNVKGICIQNQ